MQWIYRLVGFASLLANGAALTMGQDAPAPSPVVAAAVLTTAAPGEARAERGADGLFHLTGRSGDRSVAFVVDTGASVTVLTAADAARLGARPLANVEPASLTTAGGRTAMTWSRLPALEIAGQDVGAIDVAVVRSGIGRSLLGQDILAQLGTISIAGDELKVRADR